MIFLLVISSIAMLKGFSWKTTKQSDFDNHTHVNYNNTLFGRPTAAIDWCESNYEISPFVVEFWNTLTSWNIWLAGFIGTVAAFKYKCEKRFVVCYIMTQIIGLGSVLFHATLLYEWQLADELPMFWGLLVLFYILANIDRRETPSILWPISLTAYGGLATAFFIFYTTEHPWCHQVHILVGAIYGLKVKTRLVSHIKSLNIATNAHNRINTCFSIYVISGLTGFGCWIIDQSMCSQLSNLPFGLPNPQLHAFWHTFMAIHCYFGILTPIYYRGVVLKNDPIVFDMFAFNKGEKGAICVLPFVASKKHVWEGPDGCCDNNTNNSPYDNNNTKQKKI